MPQTAIANGLQRRVGGHVSAVAVVEGFTGGEGLPGDTADQAVRTSDSSRGRKCARSGVTMSGTLPMSS